MPTDDFSLENPRNNTNRRWHRLVPLEPTHSEYKNVAKLFQRGWQHPNKPLPTIQHIFKILSPESHLESYLQYRESLQDLTWRPSANKGKTEEFLFHGTDRGCLLGENDRNIRLCGLQECRLCSIIRNSFDVDKCGLKHKFKRFGSGIYTTPVSSKADDYAANTFEAASFHALLVNRVVIGNPHRRRTNARHLTKPPTGYHSVIGLPGGDLNYAETVVYVNDAIRPAYLVVYGTSKPRLNTPSFESGHTLKYKCLRPLRIRSCNIRDEDWILGLIIKFLSIITSHAIITRYGEDVQDVANTSALAGSWQLDNFAPSIVVWYSEDKLVKTGFDSHTNPTRSLTAKYWSVYTQIADALRAVESIQQHRVIRRKICGPVRAALGAYITWDRNLVHLVNGGRALGRLPGTTERICN